MIARKHLHLIVIALCLWLPLQAIAGQWLHCAQLDASLMQADESPETTPHFSCHDAPVETQEDYPASNPDQGILADTQSCKHCQFSCTWHSALVLREFTQPIFDILILYTQFTTPSPAQPLLAMPQRPPRLYS